MISKNKNLKMNILIKRKTLTLLHFRVNNCALTVIEFDPETHLKIIVVVS